MFYRTTSDDKVEFEMTVRAEKFLIRASAKILQGEFWDPRLTMTGPLHVDAYRVSPDYDVAVTRAEFTDVEWAEIEEAAESNLYADYHDRVADAAEERRNYG